MRGNIKSLNSTKEYILASKQEGSVSILPELDARNLINLPINSSVDINYLLFKVPMMSEEDNNYHLQIEFSEDDKFNNVKILNTKNNYDEFKIFNGMNMMELTDNLGISYIFSDEQIQLDLSNLDKSYKYFRYHWSNDGGESYGRYGYGNIYGLNQTFDFVSKDEDKILSKRIYFTKSDTDNVSWSGTKATFTHNMNCIPLVFIYDNELKQVLYGIELIDENSFLIDFLDERVLENEDGSPTTWMIIISYGVAY